MLLWTWLDQGKAFDDYLWIVTSGESCSTQSVVERVNNLALYHSITLHSTTISRFATCTHLSSTVSFLYFFILCRFYFRLRLNLYSNINIHLYLGCLKTEGTLKLKTLQNPHSVISTHLAAIFSSSLSCLLVLWCVKLLICLMQNLLHACTIKIITLNWRHWCTYM